MCPGKCFSCRSRERARNSSLLPSEPESPGKSCASATSTASVPSLKPTLARALPGLWSLLVLCNQLWLRCYPAVLPETPADPACVAAQVLEPVPPLTSLELVSDRQRALPCPADGVLPPCQHQAWSLCLHPDNSLS